MRTVITAARSIRSTPSVRASALLLMLSLPGVGGCAALDEVGSIDELLLSAVSGEEDTLGASASGARRAADEGAAAEPTAPPPMFRTCDAEGELAGLLEVYDEDASGALEGEEAERVEAEHGGHRGGPREGLLHMLRVVYDIDQSGVFEEGELDVILDDFTARCAAIHAELLVRFDADGDGELSEEEQEVARSTHADEIAAEREEGLACLAEGERPEGPPPGEGEGGRPDGGRGAGERPEGPPPFGPLEAEFDADGDGALSDAERATLRETLRARVRAGERPAPACAAGSDAAAG
jgi:Ca2+-binding EF-hand superfamily protein